MRPIKIDQKGQALIEALIGLPALAGLIGILVLSLAVFSLRLHLVFLAQELATCGLSVKSRIACEREAARQAGDLFRHWGFQDVSIQASSARSNASLKIRAVWSQPPVRFPLRWDLRESIPFEAQNP